MFWLQNLKDRFAGNPLGKSAKREPLYLEMLGFGLGKGHITMISVGSSDGVECMYALKQKGPDVTVHLLEPDPNNLQLCQKNISQKFPGAANQVRFHNLAASNRTADGIFYRNPDAPNLNSASANAGATIKQSVSYITLDEFARNNGITGPVVVNMDIEGHEVEVLEGFQRFACDSANQGISILMEVHPALYNEQHSLARMLEKYFAAGFRVAWMESAGVPVPDRFREKGLKPVKAMRNRGLYENPDPDFVLDVACHEYMNEIDNSGRVTKKIVRSILIQKNHPTKTTTPT